MALGMKYCNSSRHLISSFPKKCLTFLKFKEAKIYISTSTNIKQLPNPKLETTYWRDFSRKAKKSWFQIKHKSYDIVEVGEVGAKRTIPSYIRKPSYADSGIEDEASDVIEIFDSNSIKHMRQSCSLARIVLDEVSRYVEVGVTTDELDAIGHATCINFGAYPSPLNYRGFPKSICTSVNNIACHGIPDNRRLKDGDIISIDVSVFYNGFNGDCASTYCVGKVDTRGSELVETALLCLKEAIKICHHGQQFCVIGNTISDVAEAHGCSVIPAFCGHGIGTKFHCPPSILHYENEEKGEMMKGMIFTIEPVICDGRPDIVILDDGWTATTEDNSRSAQYEHTILITETGSEVLTVAGAFKVEDRSL